MRARRRPVDVVTAVLGRAERTVFHWVYGWPHGVLGMPLVVAVPALLTRRWRLAVAVASP